MRVNKFIASSTGMSRRAADKAAEEGRVKVNGRAVGNGYDVTDKDKVTLDDKPLELNQKITTIILNKPVGYVVSREGQGSQTVYDLLPKELHHLKPVGRLDKESSGLLLLTNDGELANKLTHPSFQKEKVYQIELYIPLKDSDFMAIEKGVRLQDGISRLRLAGQDKKWAVTMTEGRNRQIRRTFEELGYTLAKLHRIEFGEYRLEDLPTGKYSKV